MRKVEHLVHHLSIHPQSKDLLNPKRLMFIWGWAFIIGLIGGSVAILFRLTIEIITKISITKLIPAFPLKIGNFNFGYLLLPILAGFIIGQIIQRYSKDAQGSGVPSLIKISAIQEGNMRIRDGFAKFFLTALTIGVGGSAGKEGPIGYIGGGLGSFLSNKLGLKPQEKRLLMTCGLAAGISGTFNTPLGGAIFGLEILSQGLSIIAGIPVFLASVVGTAVTNLYFGKDFALQFPEIFTPTSGWEYFLFLFAGAIFGLIAVVWTHFFAVVQRKYVNSKLPLWSKPLIGGAITGLILLIYHENGIYGIGFDGIEAALRNSLMPLILLTLAILKMINTANTVGSGGSGGIFSPTLYVGAMFGGLLGRIFQWITPTMVDSTAIFVLIGMSAVFAGATQAPLNIAIMLVEITDHPELLPALLLPALVSYLVSRTFLKGNSIYTMNLEGYLKQNTLFYLQNNHIYEVMNPDLTTFSPYTKLSDVAIVHKEKDFTAYPVVEQQDHLIGIFLPKMLFQIEPDKWKEIQVKDVYIKDFEYLEPYQTLIEALDFFLHHDPLRAYPVVEKRINEEHQPYLEVVGMVTNHDLLKGLDL